MGTKGAQIVEMDVKKLTEMLNKALADEWLAYYQYWVGALVARGPMRPTIQAELAEHANEELGHAKMLADRIIELGGTPVLDPKEFPKLSNCGYDAPKDGHVKKLLAQNIKGEQCAIQVYNELLKKVMIGRDPITFHLLRKIMQDEVKHEQDLQDLLEDIKLS